MTTRAAQLASAAPPRSLAVAAGYLALALLLVAPALPALATAIPGGPIAAVDGWQNVWNLWWVERALAAGRDPFVTDLLFYPGGAGLHLQTLGLPQALLALPATALWGPVAGYNLALVTSLTLSGLAAHALALRVAGERRAAFLAGALFLCSPYLLTRVHDGQLELAGLHWPALYALFLLRLVEDGRRRDALGAGALLALTGLTSWYYLLFMALYSAGFALLWLPRRRAGLARVAGLLALVALTVGALLLPALGPALATSRADAVTHPGEAEVVRRSANLLDFWLPSYLHPLWGEQLFAYVRDRWHNYRGDWNVALGYSTLGLAALGAARAWPLAWRWLVLAAGALLLALGPELQVGPWRPGLSLPYALLERLPGLALGRRPALFVAVATIALVPPVALGLRALGAAIARARRPWLWALPLALAAFELAPRPPRPLPVAVHPIYAALAGGPGAVLEVPPATYKYVEPQRAQLVHGRPILGGYLARPPLYPWPNEAPAVRPLWAMRPEQGEVFLPGSDGPAAALAAQGVGAIVVRWDQIAPERRGAVERAVAQALPGVAPAYADETLSLYQVPALALGPIAALAGDGWGRPEGDGATSWRWMGERGDLALINPGPALGRFTVELAALSYGAPREVRLSLNGAPAGLWTVGLATTRVRLVLWLPPGEHRLALAAPAEREGEGGRLLSIALQEATLRAHAP
ncbi:MAG TPA: hypothetical protein PKD53_00840 [Chloroflexaceae bacterium]|nr:hypothetical protein [Chloroflexaceae bacterium]